jgi:hypothetical protein
MAFGSEEDGYGIPKQDSQKREKHGNRETYQRRHAQISFDASESGVLLCMLHRRIYRAVTSMLVRRKNEKNEIDIPQTWEELPSECCILSAIPCCRCGNVVHCVATFT